ncbi:hypothetical protein EV360DRAFT_89351 [Lentinula raphanica]|nr:hypothetical protein EV360DRAFT_89351 [Lentinula raphanica]
MPSVRPQPKKKAKATPRGEMGTGHWKPQEKNSAVWVKRFILGPESDSTFEKFQVHPKAVYKLAAAFVKTRDHNACEGIFTRSMKVYRGIQVLEKFTGGGGDGDEDDENEVFQRKRKRALDAGKSEVEGLTFAKVKEWRDNGWYQLFDDRYGKNPKTERTLNINSATPISPLKLEDFRSSKPIPSRLSPTVDLSAADDNDIPITPCKASAFVDLTGEADIEPKVKLERISTPTNNASTSKPASTSHAARVRGQNQEQMSSISTYLNNRVSLDEKKVGLQEMRFKLQQEKEQVERAKALLDQPDLSLSKHRKLQTFIISTIL